MVYDNNAANTSSTALKPVLLVVSLVTAIIFGGMYAFYSNSQRSTFNTEPPSAAVQQPAPTQQSQTVVETSGKVKNRTRV